MILLVDTIKLRDENGIWSHVDVKIRLHIELVHLPRDIREFFPVVHNDFAAVR